MAKFKVGDRVRLKKSAQLELESSEIIKLYNLDYTLNKCMDIILNISGNYFSLGHCNEHDKSCLKWLEVVPREVDDTCIGTDIEVSFDKKRWHKRFYIGRFENWYMCQNDYEDEHPIAWKYARRIKEN